MLNKGRLHIFPLNTAHVVRCRVTPTATALRLLPRGKASIEGVEAPTRDAPERVSAITLHVSQAVVALGLQWAFWSQVRLHQHSLAAEVGNLSHFGHPRTPRHRYNEVRVGGQSLAGSWSRRPERSCVTPWTRISRDASSTRTTLSGINLPSFFTRSRKQRSSGSVKVWNTVHFLRFAGLI
jgi:hypothetical protein